MDASKGLWQPESMGMCDRLNLRHYFTFRLGNNSHMEVRPGKRLEFETQKCVLTYKAGA